MTKHYDENFSEQEMFAPARIQILTETKPVKFDIRGTNPKSASQRVVNLSCVLAAYLFLLMGATEFAFGSSTTAGVVVALVGLVPAAFALKRLRKLSNKDVL